MLINKSELIEILTRLGVEEMNVEFELTQPIIKEHVEEFFTDRVNGYRNSRKYVDVREKIRINIEAATVGSSTFIGFKR